MKIETLQKRLDSKLAAIVKAVTSIETNTKRVAKKQDIFNKTNDSCDKVELAVAKSNLEDAERKLMFLNREKAELENQIAKLEEKETVLEISIFDELLKEMTSRFKAGLEEQITEIKNLIADKGYKEACKIVGGNIIKAEYTAEQLQDDAHKTAKAYVLDLARRVNAKCGEIVDYSNITLSGCALNGIIKGTKGNAVVETIIAGGYNVQCEHLRVLVK